MNQITRNSSLFALTLAAAISGGEQLAHADIGACNDIFVEASATCELVAPSAQCETMCTPISVRASCSARLAVDCRATCDELPSIDCTAQCTADCSASCTKLDPGKFDCTGECQADCSGRCSGACSADSNSAECMAHCEGSCGASCNASCEVEPPMADCDASCKASCDGSCEVDTNLDCQLQCQADAQADCEAEVQGGCVAECKTEEGAFFCDGQFVDHGDNLQDCIAALKAKYHVEVQASGESSCNGGSCEASGQVSAKADDLCSVQNVGAHDASHTATLAMMGLALALWSRRRSRRSGKRLP